MPLLYVGWIVSFVGALPLVLGGFLNILNAPVLSKNMGRLGYFSAIVPSIGVIKILIGTLILIPSASFVGVILATGWMGGVISVRVRVRDQYVVPAITPVLIWVGFGLRHQSTMHRLFAF